jgi:hypothetical protein
MPVHGIQPEELAGVERAGWWRLTPVERRLESERLAAIGPVASAPKTLHPQSASKVRVPKIHFPRPRRFSSLRVPS